LNSPEGLGIDPSTVQHGPHLILFIDYNDTYMELYVADVGDNTFKEVGKQILNLQGAKRIAQFPKAVRFYNPSEHPTRNLSHAQDVGI